LKFLLAFNERSGWVGPPGSLKSAILTSLTHAVASGQDWCGKRNKGKCAVIYFALERADLVKRRLRAYADEDGLVDLPIVVVGQTINFMDGNVANEIIATIDEVEKRFGIKVGLLIVDTLAKAIAAGGGDENTAKDQGKVYANLDRVKEQRSVHVAIACHPGKDGSKGPRGSSASTGDFGVQIEISGTDTRTATITKNNEGPLGHLASFRPKIHEFGKDEDGDSIDVCLAEEVGGVPPTGKTKLSVVEQATLDCLAEALADKGAPPPITEEIPPSVNRVVSADTWRGYVRSRGITTSDRRDTQDKAFRRASKALQKLGRVGCWNDNIWIVERRT
jgi:6,7-dimethyl-8-ribityllumazine synthase